MKSKKTSPAPIKISIREKVAQVAFLTVELEKLRAENKIFELAEYDRMHRNAILHEKPRMKSPAGEYIIRLVELLGHEESIVTDIDLIELIAAGKVYVETERIVTEKVSVKRPFWNKVSPRHIRHVMRNILVRHQGGRKIFSSGQNLGRAARC